MIALGRHQFVPRLHQRGRVRCEPGWHLGPGWARGLRDFDLWFVWAGRGRMRLEHGEVPLHPGTCIWMRPGRRYEAEQDPADPLGVNYIHFDLLPAGRRTPTEATPPFEWLQTRQLELVDSIMRRVIEQAAGPDAEAAGVQLFGALLVELVREQAAGGAGAAGTELHHRDVILRAAAQMRENPGRVPPVAELARAAGYSVDHFSRLFLEVTGLRPQNYAIRARMARARQLLAESNLTIGMVAEALGFQDIFYFSRQFRQQTGRTPSAYRRGLPRA